MKTTTITKKDLDSISPTDRAYITQLVLDRIVETKHGGDSLRWIRAVLAVGGWRDLARYTADDVLVGFLSDLGFETRKHRCTTFVTI
jgi:hypothetical protein